jgi:hypothetical protein
MATIQDFVVAKLERYNIELTPVELEVMLTDANLVATDTYTSGHLVQIKTAFVSIIPELLLRPDITEGGYSEKYDKAAIRTFYSMLCREIGVPDVFEVGQPEIRNASNLW